MASSDSFSSHDIPEYSQIACIGTGLSAVALGATLKRWYGFEDIHFFDKHPTSGGTWYINSYPGCACDVPSALYSFSFELNPTWTKVMPSNQEIKEYHDHVLDKYKLRHKMTFSTEAIRAVWREDANRWLIYLRDVNTGRKSTYECQILFAATGQLVEPRPCDIPGAEDFSGTMFHSARWNHNAELESKRVIVIGNGCTAAQIVPALTSKVKSLTQIIRTQHWIFPGHNFEYNPILRWIFRYLPFTMRLHRFHIFLAAESDFRLFPMTKAAAKFRQQRKKTVEQYMRNTAPAKRIFDSGYLQSLNDDNVLLTDAKIEKIIPEGIQTEKGVIPADVVVLATGFQTNKFLPYMDVIGRDGKSVEEHWSQYGGPSAYNSSVVNGFPNFFLLLGPNAATGHTSALMAAENSVNYALRILKPVLDGQASTVEIKQKAERDYAYWVQDALNKRVWNAGCLSWYLNDNKWNSMSYPWTQGYYWWRSLFPIWSDWNIKRVARPRRSWVQAFIAIFLLGITTALSFYPFVSQHIVQFDDFLNRRVN